MDSGAKKALQFELKKLKSDSKGDGSEGFLVNPRPENIFLWDVAIFGPPGTLYQGGYFKAIMMFPKDYPYSPPKLKFTSEIIHPNIYVSGDVCISILHPPGSDPQSGELPQERWNPTQSIRTILLSVISLLNEPNTSSPANVDASVLYRQHVEKHSGTYATRVMKCVEKTKIEARKDGVTIPETMEEYLALATNNNIEDAAGSSGRCNDAAGGNISPIDDFMFEDDLWDDDFDAEEDAKSDTGADSGNG